MPLLFAVEIEYVLIEATLALISLAVGFFSAVCYMRFTATPATTDGADAVSEEVTEEKANDAARASMAAQQLRDLAQNVAADVGAHNVVMTDVTSQLGDVDLKAPGAGEAVTEAVAKILEANGKLQTRLAEAEKKIQVQAEEIKSQHSEARTDALTGLANRRAFDDAMQQHLAQFNTQSRPFSLLIFDVDHFKKFNDTHGHQAGDEVLRSVAKTLAQVVKVSDIPCRYGGEEFALIMPSTTVQNGRIAAERVRKAIESMNVQFEDKTLQVTISVGLSEAIAEDDVTKLIRRADDAVYKSKEEGRNCGHWNDGTNILPVDMAEKNAQPAETAQEPVEESPSSMDLADTLPDEKSFTDELQRRVAESHRFGVSLSAMFISMSNYPALEQEYGSAVGTLLLDSVAQFIRTSLRDMDLLATLEPGSFGVMLPGSGDREAQVVASRIQVAISKCAVPLGGRQVQVEVSIGTSEVQPTDDAAKMIERAKAKCASDEALAAV